jgi:hypothetical protein
MMDIGADFHTLFRYHRRYSCRRLVHLKVVSLIFNVFLATVIGSVIKEGVFSYTRTASSGSGFNEVIFEGEQLIKKA